MVADTTTAEQDNSTIPINPAVIFVISLLFFVLIITVAFCVDTSTSNWIFLALMICWLLVWAYLSWRHQSLYFFFRRIQNIKP